MTEEKGFDPRMFGFDTVVGEDEHSRGYCKNKDYIAWTRTRKCDILRLRLCKDTAESAEILFGDRCGIAFNEKTGQLVMYAGDVRGISGGRPDGRADVSITELREQFERVFGKKSQVFFHAKVWAGGNAILFTPRKEG